MRANVRMINWLPKNCFKLFWESNKGSLNCHINSHLCFAYHCQICHLNAYPRTCLMRLLHRCLQLPFVRANDVKMSTWLHNFFLCCQQNRKALLNNTCLRLPQGNRTLFLPTPKIFCSSFSSIRVGVRKMLQVNTQQNILTCKKKRSRPKLCQNSTRITPNFAPIIPPPPPPRLCIQNDSQHVCICLKYCAHQM